MCRSRASELLSLRGQPSVTTTGLLLDSDVVVFECDSCGHGFKTPLPDASKFYESDYLFSVETDEEDQVYSIDEKGVARFRTEHQAKSFLSLVPLGTGAQVLDYGCGKGLTGKWIKIVRPDLSLYLFDVTAMHRERWLHLVNPDQMAFGLIPTAWHGRFDAVTLMFTLEHVEDPISVLSDVWKLLSDGGVVHGVVPNPHENFADLIVRDHIQHYSRRSLSLALERARFTDVMIEKDQFISGLTFTAVRSERPSIASDFVIEALGSVADFWRQRRRDIRDFESRNTGRRSAIFGGGVNGSFTFSSLMDSASVECFVDNNPHLQGRRFFGKPVLSPQHLPDDVEIVYIAVNPRLADAIMESTFNNRSDLIYFR